jgi:hypothetical protein
MRRMNTCATTLEPRAEILRAERPVSLRALSVLALTALAACGGGGAEDGGGGGGPPDPTLFAFADPEATGTAGLTGTALDSAARSTAGLSGTLAYGTGSFSLGPLSGAIDPGRTEVSLTGGGLVILTPADTDFAVFFDATPLDADRTIGTVGVTTPVAEMPSSGTVSYAGTSRVTVQDDLTLYDLTGSATVVADFGSGTVDTTVSGLSGLQTTGGGAPVAVSDVATISFTGSTLSGTTFSGGTPSLTSASVAGLSGGAQSSLDGAFYGPDAIEAGAAFVIDDSTGGTVTAFGLLLVE